MSALSTKQGREVRYIFQLLIFSYSAPGPTYIWTFNLKTKERPSKWVLAGVALLLQI